MHIIRANIFKYMQLPMSQRTFPMKYANYTSSVCTNTTVAHTRKQRAFWANGGMLQVVFFI